MNEDYISNKPNHTTNKYAIRNKIACGLGNQFQRLGPPYILNIHTGNMLRVGEREEPFTSFTTYGWKLI